MLAVFTSLIISTDWLIGIPNVKLVDTLVFAVSYSLGFRIGASIAIASELIWGVINPLGFGGPIIFFTVTGELLYALAGWSASRAFGFNRIFSIQNVVFGSILAISAFFFDLETNLATAFIVQWPPSAITLSGSLILGIPFAITHELSDFALGAALAPALILFFKKHDGRQHRISSNFIRESTSEMNSN